MSSPSSTPRAAEAFLAVSTVEGETSAAKSLSVFACVFRTQTARMTALMTSSLAALVAQSHSPFLYFQF